MFVVDNKKRDVGKSYCDMGCLISSIYKAISPRRILPVELAVLNL